MAIFEEGGFALGFGEGGHRKRLISYSPTLISSLFVDFGAFGLDLDLNLNGGERRPDPSFVDLLI